MDDLISRQAAIDAVVAWTVEDRPDIEMPTDLVGRIKALPSAQPEVIPHRNYKYLSDYWCECGWHLGKRGDMKYCPDCGRKVNWDG